MKLKRAQISGYKSIEQCEIEVDERLTVLAGKSESGKTSILEALSRFGKGGAFESFELCSWMDSMPHDHAIITLKFKIEEQDVRPLSYLNPALEGEKELIISRLKNGSYRLITPTMAGTSESRPPDGLADAITQIRYRGNQLVKDLDTWLRSTPSSVGESVVKSVAELTDLTRRKSLRVNETQAETDEALLQYLDALRELEVEFKALKSTGSVLRGIKSRRSRMEKDLLDLLAKSSWVEVESPAIEVQAVLDLVPRIQYLTDTDIVPLEDSVQIGILRSTNSGHPVIRGLLALAGIDQETLELADSRQLRRRLDAGEKRASE